LGTKALLLARLDAGVGVGEHGEKWVSAVGQVCTDKRTAVTQAVAMGQNLALALQKKLNDIRLNAQT
jgi:hypothetical protein